MKIKDLRTIAFYLPQFHAIPENDEWWGRGFTEWTNVTRARPQFEGHHQPRLPSDLGFYNLLLDQVRHQQAELAKKYGIDGFCYYYYWFEGRRLLEQPLQRHLEDKSLDMPFCICWANESWTRSWDGSEADILIQQRHMLEKDARFIDDLIPFLNDPRYIRVNGAPLILLYRADLLPDSNKLAKIWRDKCRDNGTGEIHLCMAGAFNATEPRDYGFDSIVQFPPHDIDLGEQVEGALSSLSANFEGKVFDYEKVVSNELLREAHPYLEFRSVMPSWDNTARKGKRATIFKNSTPAKYERWLKGIIEFTLRNYSGDEQIVFINAWNEWAEGAFLEPDQTYGHAYLMATLNAINSADNPGQSLERLRLKLRDDKIALEDISILEDYLRELKRSTKTSSYTDGYFSPISELGSYPNKVLHESERGLCCIDALNQYGTDSFENRIRVDNQFSIRLRGWTYSKQAAQNSHDPVIFALAEEGEFKYFARVDEGLIQRLDVNQHFAIEDSVLCGFLLTIAMDQVQPGDYSVFVVTLSRSSSQYVIAESTAKIRVFTWM